MAYNDKQHQILKIAEQLFAQRGYDGTSVRDIAEAAGVNIAMISYYFGSKEKMMESLFEQRTQHIRLTVETLWQNKSLAPLQKMEALVEEYIERVMDNQPFYKLMICEQVINKNPVILALIMDMKKKNMEGIEKLISYGQQKSVFKNNIDVILLMNTLTGSISQMMINMQFYKDNNDLGSLSEEQSIHAIKQKLSDHLKFLFKVLLTHEA